MLFLLRSVFWLSIVFASVSWPSDPIASVMAKARAARGVQDSLGQTIGMAQAGAEKAWSRDSAPAAMTRPRQIRRLLIRRPPRIKYNKANPKTEIRRRA
jgi:hypothetical protein